jgi:hypothetical protein
MVARGCLAGFPLRLGVMLFFVIYFPFSPRTIDGVFLQINKVLWLGSTMLKRHPGITREP